MAANKSLRYEVVRKRPELITPARQTLHEVKLLSDIDSQTTHHFQILGLSFYPAAASVEGKDPVKVIRDAIGKALVFYYPLAGRLRETASYKLAVECTGEGIIFIEADADVTLQHFRDSVLPPIPCFLELLYDVPGSNEVLHSPILLIQVLSLYILLSNFLMVPQSLIKF